MVHSADVFAEWDAAEGVASAIAAARDGVDALLRDRGLRRTTPELTVEALLRGAAASAELDGSTSSLAELRADAGDTIARAAARLNAGLLALVPVVARSPLQAIARLHTLAAAGEAPDYVGRPRSASAADQLQRLARALLAETHAPGMAVAAIGHAELLRIQPFTSHNGLVARAFERLLLVVRGVDQASLLVPEAGHLALAADYRLATEAYADGSAGGRARWLLYAARAYTQGASASPLATGVSRGHPEA